MNSPASCPRCAKPLAAGAPLGLCPECLFRAGFATASAPAGETVRKFVPPTPAELAPLFPQLEIIALIGQGGMGAVYRARQPSLDRVVALKILPPRAGNEAGFAERFMREARALARLSHPGIVAVHDFGRAGDFHYFVMEFVDGVTLRHLLTTARPTPAESLAIVPQICEALQYAHDRGIVHRDIKPENILIDRAGRVKIADFGLAKLIGGEAADWSITGAHDVVGTPHYMAPEQVEQPLAVDHRADIYSLGVVFYQLLTGELPLGKFAPPSRKVQVDVRLDHVVLRALEKEPELRYQQATGLKTEVEGIAGNPSAAEHTDVREEQRGTAAFLSGSESESRRVRWLVLLIAWTIAATFLRMNGEVVARYLDQAGRLGAPPETPLRQMFPAFAADAQMWVRHALDLLEGEAVRLRHTWVDNAPHGREVHWSSGWAWCIAGAGQVHHWVTGLPLAAAVERATLWLNPAAMLGCIILLSSWAARQFGALAGVMLVMAMTCDPRVQEGFFPSYVDHHGLQTAAVIGLLLGMIGMGGGWWHAAGGQWMLPSSAETARKAAVFSALSGAFGLWSGAASVVPAIAIVGASGALAVLVRGRTAKAQGVVFDARAWRLWGRAGAVASGVFYALEYFPGHLSLRLEVNHPLHALAWLGAGELIAQGGERWLAPASERWRAWKTLLWPLGAVSVAPVAILVGGAKVFAPADPWLAALHRTYISEFNPLWRMLQSFEPRALLEMAQIGTLPVLAALVTLIYRRREPLLALWVAAFATLAFTAVAWVQTRALLNAAGASIVLLLVLLLSWTAGARPFVRWALGLVVVGQLFLPSAASRYLAARSAAEQRRVSPADAQMALSRDIAAVLRASQPQGEIVLLASPNASATIGYYGRFKTLGTLYWENGDGLKAAARIFSAASAEEAAKLARGRGVTHIAIVSEENFIAQYYRLLHPDASSGAVERCFGYQLLTEHTAPAWLQRVPYNVPSDLQALRTTVKLYRVVDAASKGPESIGAAKTD